MDVESYWRVIASERRSLAELLASLADEQWQTPSLCASWRVRDVAAHVALVPTAPGLLALIGGVVKAGGNPNRYNHDLAVRHANRPTAVIVAELRDHADSRKLSAPTTAPNLALDILVHGQDIAVPLGLNRPMPPGTAADGATRAWNMGYPFWARRRLRGYRLRRVPTSSQVRARRLFSPASDAQRPREGRRRTACHPWWPSSTPRMSNGVAPSGIPRRISDTCSLAHAPARPNCARGSPMFSKSRPLSSR